MLEEGATCLIHLCHIMLNLIPYLEEKKGVAGPHSLMRDLRSSMLTPAPLLRLEMVPLWFQVQPTEPSVHHP